MCLYPTLIKNRKYTTTKKNKGIIPPITDERVKYVPIGCQQCIECRKQKARQWQVRLLEHIKTNTNGKFITLTFSNEAIKHINEKLEDKEEYDRDNRIATWATRHFLERWRKKYGKSLQHWLTTELGHKGTENIHLHGIIWTNEPMDTVEKIWSYGFMWKGHKKNGKLQNYVNPTTVAYITKYIMKKDEKHKTFKSKILTSPGIGNNYTNTYNSKSNKYAEGNTRETYRTTTGHEIALPIYWRNKIYTEEEREKLWLQKLDKQERWVCGEKVSIKKSDNDYYKLLEHYRRVNKELGYGNGKISWDREQYEIQRRKIMRETRIQNARKKEKYKIHEK